MTTIALGAALAASASIIYCACKGPKPTKPDLANVTVIGKRIMDQRKQEVSPELLRFFQERSASKTVAEDAIAQFGLIPRCPHIAKAIIKEAKKLDDKETPAISRTNYLKLKEAAHADNVSYLGIFSNCLSSIFSADRPARLDERQYSPLTKAARA